MKYLLAFALAACVVSGGLGDSITDNPDPYDLKRGVATKEQPRSEGNVTKGGYLDLFDLLILSDLNQHIDLVLSMLSSRGSEKKPERQGPEPPNEQPPTGKSSAVFKILNEKETQANKPKNTKALRTETNSRPEPARKQPDHELNLKVREPEDSTSRTEYTSKDSKPGIRSWAVFLSIGLLGVLCIAGTLASCYCGRKVKWD